MDSASRNRRVASVSPSRLIIVSRPQSVNQWYPAMTVRTSSPSAPRALQEGRHDGRNRRDDVHGLGGRDERGGALPGELDGEVARRPERAVELVAAALL